MAGRFGDASLVAAREADMDAILNTEDVRGSLPHLFPDRFPTTGLEAANEEGNYGGLQRLVNSTRNSPVNDDQRDRSRSRSPGRPSARGYDAGLQVTQEDEMQLAMAEATDAATFLAQPEQPDVEQVTAEDGTVFTFTRGTPREVWTFRDFSVVLPRWLAKLCSGQCVC